MFAFVLAGPVILYQLYSFLLPALSPPQHRSGTLLVLPIPPRRAVRRVAATLGS
jgi:Sec-independent protein secretion pathway component TatC